MIDTDKYEGHTEGPWEWDGYTLQTIEELDDGYIGVINNTMSYHLGHYSKHPDKQLIADAPLILEEVKRLREFKNLYSDRLMKAYDWIAHWLGEENMRMFMDTVGVTDEGDIPYMEIIKGGEEE